MLGADPKCDCGAKDSLTHKNKLFMGIMGWIIYCNKCGKIFNWLPVPTK